MALALLAFLIWLLLQWNPKTPFVFVTATRYEAPIPINAWAVEDRAALERLNGSNITVPEHLPDWNADSSHFELLPKSFDVNDYKKSAPLIVYVSAHGVVKEYGEPCILPPGASINDPKKWIPIAELLDDISKKVPSSRHTLLVLDCNRIRVNWSLGIVYNSFAERVEELVERKKVPGITVLLSAGPGQINWTSNDFRGSVFARFLQLGLAGAADAKAPGNNDNDVSLDELAAYLKHEVSAWALANRGERQEPFVLPQDAKSFHVSYPIRGTSFAIKGTSLKGLTEEFEKAEAASESASKDIEMWAQLDELRKLNLARCDPASCSSFEHQLLRLEDLSHGGEAYAEDAKKLRAELKDKLDKAVNHSSAATGVSRSAAAYFGMTSDAAWMHLADVGYSLPACEYFGACDAKQAEQVRAAWTQLIDAPATATADAVIDGSEANKLTRNLAETQFFAALRQQQVASLWPKNELEGIVDRCAAAEEVSIPRGPSGTPGDERAHYFARYAADKADPQRRLAEDLLFVGERNASKPYTKLKQKTKELYAWTSQVMEEASAAFRVRDEALSVGPYLAEWLCSPLSSGLQEREKLVNAKLVPLFHELASLNESINGIEKLSRADYLQPGASLPFHSQAERIRSDFDAIHAKFDDSLKQLAEHHTGQPTEWRHIEALLQTPIVPSTVRETLRANQVKLATRLHQEFFEAENDPKGKHEEKEGEGEPAHGQREAEASYVEMVHQWKDYPLFAILQAPPPRAQLALNWSEKASAEARHALEERGKAAAEDREATKPKDMNRVGAERYRLSDAESDLRSRAALIYDSSDERTDETGPVDELRRFDIQQLLIWNGERAVADFWQNTVKTDSPNSFFARAAGAYLHAANGLIEPPISAVTEQIERVEQSIPTKPEQFPITAAARLAPESEKAAVVSITVGEEAEASRFPKGVGALFLRDDSHRLVDLAMQTDPPGRAPFVDMSAIGGKAQRFDVNIADTTAYSSALQAVAFFRGRRSTTDFGLPVTGGVRVAYTPYVYKDQSITLSGDRLQRSSIEFILDCSDSMNEQTSIKGEVKSETEQRLSLAKKQLKTMLDELVARNQQNEEIHVGVRFFGHRVGWEVDEKGIRTGKMSVQKAYESNAAEWRNLGPSRDVERVNPISRFDDTVNEEIKRKITKLEPWGETPLYLALKEALQDFQGEGADSRKCIIAITDGMNYQTKPDTFAKDVRDAWQNHQVPIYILGFDITKDEVAQAKREYTELAEATGGKFLPVKSGSELLNTLRQTLPIDLYSVSDSGHPPTKLNDPTPIDSSQLPKDYAVSYRGIAKSVRLEGGEAIALYMSDNGQDMVAKPYKSGIDQANLGGGTSRKPIALRVYQPLRDKTNNSVQFPISLQVDPRADHFTGRPLETWLEITPLAENVNAGQPYVFYDVNYEPHEPVPVLKWTALHWPKDADHARIRFWCKYVPTNPTQTIALRDLLNTKQSVAGIELSAKTSSDGDQYAVRIEERHGPQSPGIDDFQITFENELHEKPRRVIHVFDAQRGVATHSFYFPAALKESIERPQMARVVVTRGRDLKDGALQLSPDGIVVRISAAGESFAPSATAGGR